VKHGGGRIRVLGVVRKLPYRLHLALDAMGAAGLAAAAATRRDALDRFLPVAVGIYELAAVALSDPKGAGRSVPLRGEG